MIKIYHAPFARSLRVIWLLEELGLPYEVEKVEFNKANLNSPEYLAVHPLGKVPAIDDGEVHMIESGAIVQYILERYGKGRLEPEIDSPDRPAFLQWMHFGEATAVGPIGAIVQNTHLKPEAERIPEVVVEARQTADRYLGVLEAELSRRDYMVDGEFSAADIMIGYALVLGKMIGVVDDRYPRINAYLERLQSRSAYVKASSV